MEILLEIKNLIHVILLMFVSSSYCLINVSFLVP